MRKILAALVLAVTGCNPPSIPAPPAKTDMQLGIYEVPPGTARDLRSALNNALQGSGKEGVEAFGRASLAPDGRLVVLAPEKIQQGVRSMVEQVARKPAAVPARADMTYWFVAGKRAEKAELPPSLAEIKPALDELVRTQGPMQFRQIEQLKISTLSGENGSARGATSRVNQEPAVGSGVVMARVNLSVGSKNLDTTLQIKPRQLVVLGQSNWSDKEGDAEEALFYVVRADVTDAAPAGP